MPASGTRLAMLFALALGMATASAHAQELVKVPDGTLMGPWNMTAGAVKKLDVLGANGQKVGEVDDVIGTSPATPTALTVDFKDGSGFDDRDDIAIPLGAFTMRNKGLLLTVGAADVANMPQWDD